MSDIVTRLRQYGNTGEPLLLSDDAILDEAAAEIERLRLTDAEREAVAYYIGTGGPDSVDATLRGLLERLT